MKLSIFLSVLSTHQEGLCNAFYNLLREDFKVVLFGRLPQYRIEAGFEDLSQKYSYCLVLSEEPEERTKMLKEIVDNSDVGIVGGVTDSIFDMFLNQNKRCFLFSERFYKKGAWRRILPRVLKGVRKRFRNSPNFEVLCASAYLPHDLKISGYKGKCLQWGYFPQISIGEYKQRDNSPVKIMWAARFIDWKHPETIIKCAKVLKKNGLSFEITMIGAGKLGKKYVQEAKDIISEGFLKCLAPVPPQQIHKMMQQADIFVATSDYNEGWGVVINESMANGCAVVASSAMGAVPFMIENGYNGYSYKWNDFSDFNKKVEMLIKNPDLRESAGKNAYRFVQENYSPEVAADRFCRYINGENFDSGICSVIE